MRRIIVVGAGIVGVSLARELTGDGVSVTVLEQATGAPRGSTSIAPGFIGLHNDAQILIELATKSADVYSEVGAGFERVGGLELATTDAGMAQIDQRITAAELAGLTARQISPEELPRTVSGFVDAQQIVGGAFYSHDGVAEPALLTAAMRKQAIDRGATFLEGQAVVGIERVNDHLLLRTANGEDFIADDVILAGGVWGPTLAALVGLDLPLYPVSHPYVYSSTSHWTSGPFVRWPDRHVYARVHGNKLGIGSYDHLPVPATHADLASGAGIPWDETFTPVVEAAQGLLRDNTRFTPAQRTNGIFAMTPDNLPFVGPNPAMAGVWIAQAVWVTHAAGVAARLAAALLQESDTPSELQVDRFDGLGENTLKDAAYRLYRDIYANEAQ